MQAGLVRKKLSCRCGFLDIKITVRHVPNEVLGPSQRPDPSSVISTNQHSQPDSQDEVLITGDK
jgi:hypothetical protein